MTRIFVIAAVLLLMVGCKKTESYEPVLAKNGKMVNSRGLDLDKLGAVIADEYLEFYGIWEGDIISDEFDSSRVWVKIQNIQEGKVTALVIINDQQDYVSGKYESSDGKFSVNLKKGSGNRERCIFELNQIEDKFEGTYFAKKGDKGSKVSLVHKVFKYDANAMLETDQVIDLTKTKKDEITYTDEEVKKNTYERAGNRYTSENFSNLNSSTQELTEAQLKNLYKIDLEILRNTIYARHGYIFKREYLRHLFDNTTWYVPVSENVEASLTPLEQKNIKLISRMEKYAQDHYSYFGR